MKRFLIITIFLLLLNSGNAQSKKPDAFFMGTFHVDIIQNKIAGGARISAGTNLNDQLLFGLGLGIIKIQGLPKTIIPIFAEIAYADFSKKVTPLLIVEPGYGLYNRTSRSGPLSSTTKGGFNFTEV